MTFSSVFALVFMLVVAFSAASAVPTAEAVEDVNRSPVSLSDETWSLIRVFLTQDLRLISSFVLGLAVMHILETAKGGATTALTRPRKFEMYPYVM